MNDKIQMIADKYGFAAQAYQTMEECAELIQALNKHIRSSGTRQTRDNVIEEIADVQIMIAQIKYLMNCEVDVINTMQLKIERTIKRMRAKSEGK